LLPDRINIGCGYDHKPDYLNVDMDPACKPDLLLTNNDFSPLPKRHFREVLANDVLEHIPRAQTMSALLEWADLLALGGTLTLKTSSFFGIVRMMQASNAFEHQHRCTIYMFGNQAHPGDFHHTAFTESTLRTFLLSAGFRINTLEEVDDWLYLAISTRTEDWTVPLQIHAGASDEEFLLAAYESALMRAPEEPFLSYHLQELATGQSRRELLKTLYGSIERNYRMAMKHSL
jgi:predicted SAM-dependent methyltransferase